MRSVVASHGPGSNPRDSPERRPAGGAATIEIARRKATHVAATCAAQSRAIVLYRASTCGARPPISVLDSGDSFLNVARCLARGRAWNSAIERATGACVVGHHRAWSIGLMRDQRATPPRPAARNFARTSAGHVRQSHVELRSRVGSRVGAAARGGGRRYDSGFDGYHETHLIVTMCSKRVPSLLGCPQEDKGRLNLRLASAMQSTTFHRKHCDVLSMQMDSDLVIYRTTLVRTFQVVTICRVDKSEAPRRQQGSGSAIVANSGIIAQARILRAAVRHARRTVLRGDAALDAAACDHAPHAMLAAAAVRRISGSDATAIFLLDLVGGHFKTVDMTIKDIEGRRSVKSEAIVIGLPCILHFTYRDWQPRTV
ncbi:G protein-regulated inducer of neurite outgrowth 1-like [Dorcoceras hygrometricum]|uniref:G protein-regulated inducer of neurite outgrowth 1-like n=1 Tax=Dorcoceras hygrometricum TaxID=472368 RepID=A0A2Z7A9V8_9LAMI|nr:G protein-regulated inducer of neurite outgrowth 1-like [Dorcoceras hygrometricum]